MFQKKHHVLLSKMHPAELLCRKPSGDFVLSKKINRC